MNHSDLLKKIRRLDIISKRQVNTVFSGQYRSSFRGEGVEVADIFEYEEGMDIRHIDWNTTAKTGKPFVKKYEETKEMRTMVVIDTSSSMHFGSSEKTKADVAMETVAILLFSALKNGDPFGAYFFNDKNQEYIPPKKGRRHLLHIFQKMILAFEHSSFCSANQKKALNFLSRTAKHHGIFFFLSDEVSENAKKEMRLVARKHDFLFLRPSDPVEETGEFPQGFLSQDLETGTYLSCDLSEAAKKRFQEIRKQRAKKRLAFLQSLSIPLLNIGTDANIFAALLSFFQKRQHALAR